MITCSFEAVGTGKTAELSLDMLHQESVSIWVGNAEKMINVNMQNIVIREIKILGSYLYRLDDSNESLRLISHKLVNCRALVTKVISLEEGPEYFEKLSNNSDEKLLKIVIDPRK